MALLLLHTLPHPSSFFFTLLHSSRHKSRDKHIVVARKEDAQSKNASPKTQDTCLLNQNTTTWSLAHVFLRKSTQKWTTESVSSCGVRSGVVWCGVVRRMWCCHEPWEIWAELWAYLIIIVTQHPAVQHILPSHNWLLNSIPTIPVNIVPPK